VPVVVADHGHVVGHPAAHLVVNVEDVFRALPADQVFVDLLLAPALGIVKRFGPVVVTRFGEPDRVRTGDAAAVDAGEQGVRSQPVGAVDRVVAGRLPPRLFDNALAKSPFA